MHRIIRVLREGQHRARVMMLMLFLCGFAASISTVDALIEGQPRRAANKKRTPIVVESRRRALQLAKHSILAHATVFQPTQQELKLSTTLQAFSGTPSGRKALPQLPKEEFDTLTALYHSMAGSEWHIADSWMSGSNPCGDSTIGSAWYGVQCTLYVEEPVNNSTPHVTGLVLRQNNLVGNLPSLRSLQHLIHLDFSNPSSSEGSPGLDNSVGGTLDALCGLSELSTALLARNMLTGSIPDCIGSLTNATVLGLDYNAILGTTPDSLCSLHSLEELRLCGNNLQGTVPVCLGKALTALRVIDYSNMSPDLSAGNQSLSGTLPASLCDLEHLETLLFQWTQGLDGKLPSCLGARQPKFQHLLVQDNRFTGPMPVKLCQARALESLYLRGNYLTGTLPKCLGNLSHLYDLEVNQNRFYGVLPEELCQATALKYLSLWGNDLTGTLPNCLGNLSNLYNLELENNYFHGTVPAELCQASALQLLLLNDNILTGSIPSCLARSFPLLQVMLLHDNDLTGAVPSEWALPSLVSIVLSNNPKLGGSLPTSLFTQIYFPNVTSTLNNTALRVVVIEGTSVGGTLPTALCSATQLVTLVLSGNRLTGTLPGCIASLRNLQTLRISNNHLTGILPDAIDNMTSLTVLDLSSNLLQGRVPAALGDMSPNLDTMKLHLNRLSCGLPTSVLDWQVSSAEVSFSLLDGNLFGCGTSTHDTIFALSIQNAAGLRDANKRDFDAYTCGNSVYVLPVITIAIFAAPFVVWLAVAFCSGWLALQWRVTLERMINPSTLINEIDHADRQLRLLALGVMAAATLTGITALVLSLYVAKSAFECEFVAAPTLANKRNGDMHVLSVGIGAVGCVGLALGLTSWWRRLIIECGRSAYDYGGSAMDKELLNVVEDETDAWDFDAERNAEAIPLKASTSYFDGITRALKLATLLLTLTILTIGPNFGYVLVVISDLTLEQKVASEMAVTLAKTTIATLLVPRVARNAVDLIVLNGALAYVRFRLRMVIGTALSALTMIVLPVTIVLLTDKRCLYHAFKSQPAVDTDVPVLYCSLTGDWTGNCVDYSTYLATSTYTPSFAYDGEVCVSAVLSMYGPVFLGAVLLAATLPAGLEVGIVPLLAPWCYRNAESSSLARACLRVLRAVTWNVWPVLASAGVLASNFSLRTNKLDHLAQRVVERAFLQLMATLIVALTFGIAVPAVGGACAVAAFVHLLHHRHVLGQIVSLGRLERPAIVPNLMGCMDIPLSCSLVVVAMVVLVWMCGAVSYLDPAVLGVTFLIGFSVMLAVCGGVAWCRTYRSKPS